MSAPQFADTAFKEPTAWPSLEPERVPQSVDWTNFRGRMPRRAEVPQALPENVDPRSVLPKEPLSAVARSWIRELPLKVRPGLTAQRHPHVINRLSLLWDHPVDLQDAFNSLLLSSRIDRKGFALEVLDELLTLQTFSKEPRRR